MLLSATGTNYKINLVQCRPLQIKESSTNLNFIPEIAPNDLILRVHSGIIGRSRSLFINRFIYVEPTAYGILPEADRYTIARIIGKLMHMEDQNDSKHTIILGPGRWGTTTPSLGVPVSFNDINTVSVICEMETMHEGLVPDLSLGTHFFNDFVEMDLLYIGLFNREKENVINKDFFSNSTNSLTALIPEACEWSNVIKVVDTSDKQKVVLAADTIKQKALVYIDDK